MSKVNDQIRGRGHEADDIEEYDNPMPDWWIGLFLVTIAWGAYYLVDWHVLDSKSQEKMYEAEVAEAKVLWPELDKKAAFDQSPDTLALGGEVFGTTCASCHQADLRGGIGPNLVDDTWIHGSDFDSIVKTINEGVAAKGMPAWGPMLGPKKVAAVASYVMSKHEGGTAAAPDATAPTDGAVADAGAAATPMTGEEVFVKNCVACHQADMTGGVGPNLVDAEWIHGGELAQIQATITNGVPAKGMITWKGVLTDEQIAAVAQYIYDKSHPK